MQPTVSRMTQSPLIRKLASGLFVTVCLVSVTASADGYTSPDTIDGTTRIDAEGLIELVNRNANQVIIDSRISSDRKLGFIPGSVSLPDTGTSCDSLADIIPDLDEPVVFYCNGPKCRRSDKAVVIATECGYTKVYWFRGGIEAWKASSYPVNK